MNERALYRVAAVLLALAAGVLPTSCDDPSCALAGDCSATGNGGGGLGGDNPAFQTSDHHWLSPSAPSIVDFFPEGVAIAKTTPIVVVFSESMAPSTLSQAFELAPASGGGGGPQALPLTSVLVGDGRVAVLFPATSLNAGAQFVVRFREDVVVTDLQGSELIQPADLEVGSFTVASTDPATPQVVTSFPPDGATSQSATGEYVVVFDRPLDPLTVNLTSWLVREDGNIPANNPAPTSLTINLGQGAVPETRVFRWRSLDVDGGVDPFDLGAQVTLRLSPAASPISAPAGGGELAQTDLDFRVSTFGPPAAIAVTSSPDDAIGIENLDEDLTNDLAIGVDLDAQGALETDLLGMFLIGTSLGTDARLIALFREVELGDLGFDTTAVPPVTIVTLGESELNLASSAAPVVARFKEGEVAIGLALRRGTTITPVRMLDLDAEATGTQNLVLDITPPQFDGFGSTGTETATFTSDLIDLSVVGCANEAVRSAEVVFDGTFDNGTQPPVVAASSNGLFVAAPVDLDVLDAAQQGLSFDLVVYDRALNPAVATTTATFQQIGGIGPGQAVPGAVTTIDVFVFDARTLRPIEGAKLYSHEDDGTASFDLVDGPEVTNLSGFAQLESAIAPTSFTTLTVEATLYDLFSITGIDVSRVSVALQKSSTTPGALAGAVTNPSSFTAFTRLVADTRRLEAAEPTSELTNCSTVSSTSVCQFGPLLVQPGPVGAFAYAAVQVPISSFGFSASDFLRSYALQIPLAGVNPGAPGTVNLTTTQLLSDLTTPTEERALAGPEADLDLSSVFGLSFGVPDATGPRVTIEALAPGLRGPILAGMGAALDPMGTPATSWEVRSALPGVVDPTDGKYPGDEKGQLVLDGTLEAGLYLRCEVRDTLLARAGIRVPFTTVAPLVLQPAAPPLVVAPIGNSGPVPFDVQFTDVIPDGGPPGIHRVSLTETGSFRRWVFWRVDRDLGAGPEIVRVPDLPAAGGPPFTGTLSVEVASFAYAGLDPTRMLFSELERRTEIIAFSPPAIFAHP
jgi:hypothetical protein